MASIEFISKRIEGYKKAIGAGGYNIQCFHFGTLIHRV